METEVFYDLVLANQNIMIDNLSAAVTALNSQIDNLTFICVVLLLTACLQMVFFNRRV